MKKLTTMFSIAAFAMTLGAAGCKKKAAEEGKEPAMKTEEKGSAMADDKKPEEKKPEDKKPDGSAAPAAAAGDLPAECADYKAAVEKLMLCEKLKATAGPMKDAMEQMMKQVADAPAASRAAMGPGCKAGADAIKTSLTSMGC